MNEKISFLNPKITKREEEKLSIEN